VSPRNLSAHGIDCEVVQSVLCRTATFTTARLLNLKELLMLIDQLAAIDKTGSPCRGETSFIDDHCVSDLAAHHAGPVRA
jgi:hypothetical protein